METDKIYELVVEIQKSIESTTPQEQKAMLSELFDMVSQIEQSLAEIKLDINEIENEE